MRFHLKILFSFFFLGREVVAKSLRIQFENLRKYYISIDKFTYVSYQFIRKRVYLLAESSVFWVLAAQLVWIIWIEIKLLFFLLFFFLTLHQLPTCSRHNTFGCWVHKPYSWFDNNHTAISKLEINHLFEQVFCCRFFRNKSQKRVVALNRELPPRNEQFLIDFEQLQSQFPVSRRIWCTFKYHMSHLFV